MEDQTIKGSSGHDITSSRLRYVLDRWRGFQMRIKRLLFKPRKPEAVTLSLPFMLFFFSLPLQVFLLVLCFATYLGYLWLPATFLIPIAYMEALRLLYGDR